MAAFMKIREDKKKTVITGCWETPCMETTTINPSRNQQASSSLRPAIQAALGMCNSTHGNNWNNWHYSVSAGLCWFPFSSPAATLAGLEHHQNHHQDQRVDAWDCGTELILPGVQRAQRTSSVQAQAPFPQGELSKNSFLSSLSCANPLTTLHGSVFHPFLFGATSWDANATVSPNPRGQQQ